jgi:hypothetical protein
MIDKILASIGIICFLIAGLMANEWDKQALAVLYAIANGIIFLR